MVNTFLIKADNISIIRKGRRILDKVSLSVARGEFITIVGPNGAGKTMLLHAMMGLMKPDEGAVTRAPGLHIGYAPQRFAPEPTLPITVRRFLQLSKGATREGIDESLGLCDAADLAGRPLRVLSGGEMQRVLLARALLRNPDILVLDEPAQNLDVGGQISFYRLLDDIYKARGCAVLMVSHDLHMVMARTSKVVCLFHHICCSGAPEAVAQDPAFTAMFGPDMSRMMSVYHHTHSHAHADHTHEHGEGCGHDH